MMLTRLILQPSPSRPLVDCLHPSSTRCRTRSHRGILFLGEKNGRQSSSADSHLHKRRCRDLYRSLVRMDVIRNLQVMCPLSSDCCAELIKPNIPYSSFLHRFFHPRYPRIPSATRHLCSIGYTRTTWSVGRVAGHLSQPSKRAGTLHPRCELFVLLYWELVDGRNVSIVSRSF